MLEIGTINLTFTEPLRHGTPLETDRSHPTMRAALFGIAVTIAGLGATAPAQALPMPGAAPMSEGLFQQAQYHRRIVRGPRCRTIVTKHRGRFGRVVVTRERRCF